MASTLLASAAIMLCSVIAVMMTNGNGDRSVRLVVGDKSEVAVCVKFFLILFCFLVAFLFNVQSVRYYSHASILINVPYKKIMDAASNSDGGGGGEDCVSCVTAEYVGGIVNRASYFWSLGLRAFYFSLPLLLWIFGPIPMFLSCILLVFMLYFLDVILDFGWVATSPKSQCITSKC